MPLVILQCVRWYSKYTISYRQLEEMMAERGVVVDHTTIWRWIQHYAPLLEKGIRWYQGYTDGSWRVDETCIRVRVEVAVSSRRQAGRMAYLTNLGDTLISERSTGYALPPPHQGPTPPMPPRNRSAAPLFEVTERPES